MANQGAKKRKEENERHVKRLQYCIIGINVAFLLLRLGLRFVSFTWRHWFGLLFTSAVYVLTFGQIQRMAVPSYDEKGELIDGGYDMAIGGVAGYVHDVLYITMAVQLLGSVTDYAWYLYLAIPVFAFYKLWEYVIYPYLFQQAPREEQEDARAKKKREKAERQQARLARRTTRR
eukprot:TRINITY_DN5333_c0_g1_i1.p1 TRINITY_DN5333_c0_g1~~TRINITY_DN5333_c0_g1_i1.p1  ORF type:complete len:175 (+),score=29.14 TRINITY_DN5333_c0_g1_i1:201-725(+)